MSSSSGLFVDPTSVEYGKYERLGQGSFGIVIKGRFDGRDVAIKIPTLLVADAQNELKTMAQLRHKNILGLLGVVENGCHLIFEFMENGSLASFVAKANVTNELGISLMYDIAAGMSYLHEMDVIHRDLAARNVLLDDRKRAKVADFGLSRLLDVDTTYYYQVQAGKPFPVRWVPAESFPAEGGSHGKFSTASDVWSYGVTVWEIWSKGAVPYGRISDNKDVQTEVQKGGNPLTHQKPAQCPEIVVKLLKTIFQVDPKQRPRFDQLKVDISNLKNGRGTTLATVAPVPTPAPHPSNQLCEGVSRMRVADPQPRAQAQMRPQPSQHGLIAKVRAALGFDHKKSNPDPFFGNTRQSDAARPLKVRFCKAKLPKATFGASAVYDGSDHIYIIGGKYSSNILKYSIFTDALEVLGAFPHVYSGAAIFFQQHIIYLGGQYSNEILRYSTVTRVYTKVNSLPMNLCFMAFAWDPDGEWLYLFGGDDGEEHRNEILRYNPRNNDIVQVGQLPEALSFAAATWFDGRALIFPDSSSEVLEYNPATGCVTKWPPSKSKPIMYWPCAVMSRSEQAYVFGGREWYSYDPVSRKVEKIKVDGWGDIDYATCVYVPPLDRIYIFGGNGQYSGPTDDYRNEIVYVDLNKQ